MPASPFLPIAHPVVESGPMAVMTTVWQAWARAVQRIVVGINTIPGVNRQTFVELNALGLGLADANYVAWEPNYGHSLQWTGSVWQFAPGDVGNGFFRFTPIVPQEIGWQLCDGTVTDYLTVGGATLSATPFTAPNVTAGTFLKVLAAYTGSIEAAIAAGISGNTGGHDLEAELNGTNVDATGVGAQQNVLTSISPNSHSHSNGSLANNTAARPPSLGGLLYFRR